MPVVVLMTTAILRAHEVHCWEERRLLENAPSITFFGVFATVFAQEIAKLIVFD